MKFPILFVGFFTSFVISNPVKLDSRSSDTTFLAGALALNEAVAYLECLIASDIVIAANKLGSNLPLPSCMNVFAVVPTTTITPSSQVINLVVPTTSSSTQSFSVNATIFPAVTVYSTYLSNSTATIAGSTSIGSNFTATTTTTFIQINNVTSSITSVNTTTLPASTFTTTSTTSATSTTTTTQSASTSTTTSTTSATSTTTTTQSASTQTVTTSTATTTITTTTQSASTTITTTTQPASTVTATTTSTTTICPSCFCSPTATGTIKAYNVLDDSFVGSLQYGQNIKYTDTAVLGAKPVNISIVYAASFSLVSASGVAGILTIPWYAGDYNNQPNVFELAKPTSDFNSNLLTWSFANYSSCALIPNALHHDGTRSQLTYISFDTDTNVLFGNYVLTRNNFPYKSVYFVFVPNV